MGKFLTEIPSPPLAHEDSNGIYVPLNVLPHYYEHGKRWGIGRISGRIICKLIFPRDLTTIVATVPVGENGPPRL